MTSSGLLVEVERIANDVLSQARLDLMSAMRFMDIALWRMPFVCREMSSAVGTDGYALYFDALKIAERYKESPSEVARDYIHAILQCVFRHPFNDGHSDTRLWDIACDVCVESIAMDLCATRFPCIDDAARKIALKKLLKVCPQLTAQKVYSSLQHASANEVFALERGIDAEFVEMLHRLFARDEHSVWPRSEESVTARVKTTERAKRIQNKGDLTFEPDEIESASKDEVFMQGQDLPGVESDSKGGQTAEGTVESGTRFTTFDAEQHAENHFEDLADLFDNDIALSWLDISKQLETELELFSGMPGETSRNFLANLRVSNRKKYDYRDFLRRFSAISEELKVNDDEFDYVYYTYGLGLYENMPLIEPLEYQETDRVRDFVIAIDTSSSCAGKALQRFIEKTYDILNSTAGFGMKTNVHVIQCDSAIRKDTHVTSKADLERMFTNIQVRGFGGTDFRPVFRYVDELIEHGEFSILKGLIYLTDGIGKYPESPPSYDTAFVFVDDIPKDREVPPWAMKVVMTQDQIIELE